MPASPFTSREEIYVACQSFSKGDAEAFQRIVVGTLDVLGLMQLELAAYLDVARSTVSRWANGSHLPPRHLQPQVIRDISRRILHGMKPRIPDLRVR